MKTKFFLSFLLFIFTPFTALAQGATSTPTSTPKTQLSSSTPQLIAKVTEAKFLLSPLKLNYQLKAVYQKVTKGKQKGKTVLSRYELTQKDILLAVFDPIAQTTSVVRGTQRGRTMAFQDPNVTVELTSFNGVNSRFKVSKPSGGFVIALKYLISPTESGSKASIEGSLEEATYVPYSPELNRPEVVAYGASYLNNLIERATYELQLYPSVSEPGKTVVEAIKPALVKALLLAEHTNGWELMTTEDPRGVIDRVNVLFATNGEVTYRYSGSSAGARGLSQFIPSTYRGLVQRHPRANLEPDFVRGMSDHVNSVKATYLLLDDYINGVKQRASAGFSSGSAFDYGVAAYNGGVVRVARAVNTFGPNWNQDQSQQLSALRAQVDALRATEADLKAKVKKAKDSKTKNALTTELKQTQRHLSLTREQLSGVESSTLRAETVGYLQKIYRVISYLHTQEN